MSINAKTTTSYLITDMKHGCQTKITLTYPTSTPEATFNKVKENVENTLLAHHVYLHEDHVESVAPQQQPARPFTPLPPSAPKPPTAPRKGPLVNPRLAQVKQGGSAIIQSASQKTTKRAAFQHRVARLASTSHTAHTTATVAEMNASPALQAFHQAMQAYEGAKATSRITVSCVYLYAPVPNKGSQVCPIKF
jgi:hypothetical protein